MRYANPLDPQQRRVQNGAAAAEPVGYLFEIPNAVAPNDHPPPAAEEPVPAPAPCQAHAQAQAPVGQAEEVQAPVDQAEEVQAPVDHAENEAPARQVRQAQGGQAEGQAPARREEPGPADQGQAPAPERRRLPLNQLVRRNHEMHYDFLRNDLPALMRRLDGVLQQLEEDLN